MTVTVEELSRFVASEPPREIPSAVRAARLPTAALVIAWTVVLVVAVGTWPLIAAVFPTRLVDDLRLDLGTPGIAAGTVVSIEPSGRSVVRRDGDTDVELTVHRIRFRFTADDGREVEAACFRSDSLPTPEDEVGVEYVRDDPSVARIVGATLSPTPRIGALVILMPAIAVAWLLKVLSQRRRMRELLERGRFVTAQIIDLVEHGATLGPGRIVATLRTPSGEELELDFDLARREGALLRERAASTRTVGLLRDPSRRQRVLLTDALLARPSERADDGGDAEEEDDEDETP